VTAGTRAPGGATVPWTAFSEDVGGGRHGIFISCLVGGDDFELLNGGNPVSPADQDASQPDITFFGNTLYVSWTAKHGDETRGFVGHFDAAGAFILDTPGGIRVGRSRGHGHGHGPASLIDARVPVSSSCTADPFTKDGATCTAGDLNAPFYTFTTAGLPQRLFAQAATEGPTCVIFARCRLQVKVEHNVATIIARLRNRQGVGILVQRVSGKHLKKVGRVPLGRRQGRPAAALAPARQRTQAARRPVPRDAARGRQEEERARPHPAGQDPGPLSDSEASSRSTPRRPRRTRPERGGKERMGPRDDRIDPRSDRRSEAGSG